MARYIHPTASRTRLEEGQNLKIEVRFAEGRNERFAEIAAEFAALKVNMIVSSGGAVPAIMRTTSTIPIIFAGANDPVGSGYVTSLARPGGNVTGLSLQSADLVGKRLELLRELKRREITPFLGGTAVLRWCAVLGGFRP